MQKVLPKGNLLGARNQPVCAQCSVIRWSDCEDLSRQAVAVGRSAALSIAVRGDGGHSNNGIHNLSQAATGEEPQRRVPGDRYRTVRVHHDVFLVEFRGDECADSGERTPAGQCATDDRLDHDSAARIRDACCVPPLRQASRSPFALVRP